MLRKQKRWSVPPAILLLFLTVAMLSGCKKNPAEEASDSDANGYVCNKCSVKLYFPRSDFPVMCPKCKDGRLDEVVAFSCEKDQHLTLVDRVKMGGSGIACEKCGNYTRIMRLPRAKDLQAWGATKVSQ